MAIDDNDDEHSGRRSIVGYGRPPAHSQFRKGQSGNPKGRPKTGSLSTLDQQLTLTIVLSEAERSIPLREGDRIEMVPARNALVRSSFLQAMKGDVRAQALVYDKMEKAEEAKAQQIARRNEIWESYQSRARKTLEEAARRGLPPPKLLPHPDDIVISTEAEPCFLGPLNEDDEAKLDHTLRLREVLTMQDALDQRSSMRLDGQPLTEPGAAQLLAVFVDRCAPPRLRLSDLDFVMRALRYGSVPKRDLKKNLYSAWREVGMPMPRGHVSPNRSAIVCHISMLADLLKASQAGAIDLNEISAGEWNDVSRSILRKYGYDLPPNVNAEMPQLYT